MRKQDGFPFFEQPDFQPPIGLFSCAEEAKARGTIVLENAAPSNRPRDIPAHTGLRGIAALVVVVAHLKLELMYPVPLVEWAVRFVQWKGQAVDLFFILSGFVLCHVYGFRMKIDWKDYSAARFARIYPLALATMLILVALDVYSYLRHGIASENLDSSRIVLNTLLLNGIKDSWVFQGINPPSWSISVEAFLYVTVFPLLIFLTARGHRSSVRSNGFLLATALLLLIGLYLFYEKIPIVGEHTRLLRGVFGLQATPCVNSGRRAGMHRDAEQRDG
ncbi:MAG: acyltransferase [Verrucomicrobiales bacterium]